jgi:hypothetical protein
VSDTSEKPAEKIAEKIAAGGREALISRLRPAFEEAAAAHADVLKLGPDQIENMIQRAADRADGLQWRRALAAVATDQLGISLGEALSHPAVVRAHELVEAPSYEASLAELGPLPPRPAPTKSDAAQDMATEPESPAEESADDAAPAPEADADEPEAEPSEDEPAADEDAIEGEPATSEEPEQADEDEPAASEAPEEAAESDAATSEETASEEPEQVEAEEVEDVAEPAGTPLVPEEHPIPQPLPDLAAEDFPGSAEYDAEGWEEEFYDEDDAVRVSVIHLGGIANLTPGESGIELLMSGEGLDIIRGSSKVLGRLEWDQVRALEVPLPRGRRRMRKPSPTHLVIRTVKGDASFEVPEVTPEELRQHLAPVTLEHVDRTRS